MAARKTGTDTPVTEDEPFTDAEREAAGLPPLDIPKDNAPVVGAQRNAFTQAQMMELAESADPLALLAEWAGTAPDEIVSVLDVLGDGTQVVEKPMLVNREFYVIDWRFHESKKVVGKYFSAVKCVDINKPAGAPGRLFVFTDGGSGIYERLAMFQLKLEEESDGKVHTVPMHVPYGLSPSTYDLTDEETGLVTGTGTTWYFANSPTK